jgi:C1A family cysteine protease
MKFHKWPLLILIAAVTLSAVAGAGYAQVPESAPKKIYTPPPENFGYQPPPVDLGHLQPSQQMLMGPMQPASWDWRTMSGVSSVKNQNPYGTCWSFCYIGCLESQVLLADAYEPDYSELNVVSCVPHTVDCNSGGHAWMVTNYLTTLATVDETCDPYPGGCPTPTCINPSCSFLQQVIEWRVIPNDVTAIKNAVMNYGPVYSGMYASFPGFSSYDGSYCLTHTGSEDPNHAVLIVGWDDTMCSGNGAWIVKNSWGSAWGDNGYFYIQYGHARMGTDACVVTGYKDIDPTETIYYYDDLGWESSVGFGDGNDWGLVAVIPSNSGEYLLAVDFWATGGPTTYDITVYNGFSGGVPSTVLWNSGSAVVQEAGYYSVPLGTPLPVSANDTIYLEIDFNTTPYEYPVPYDPNGTMETNRCYISNDGTSYTALDNGGYAMGDIGIRARIGVPQSEAGCSKEGDPALYVDFSEDTRDVIAGETVEWTIGPANFGFVSATCTDMDTFCVSASSSSGWTISAEPPLGACHDLDPGYLWWQDISIYVPCDVSICDYDTLIVGMHYCNTEALCDPDCNDLPECEDPNWYNGNPYFSADTVILHVVESPPALYILQDSLFLVSQGQTAAYVPFALCNGDPCAPPTLVNYSITSKGWIPGNPGYPQAGSISVGGGDCENVYAVVNAGSAAICDLDTLTIIAWIGSTYDTCVQIIHIVEAVEVPLFSAPVVTILALAMILAAAVIMRKRAAGRV